MLKPIAVMALLSVSLGQAYASTDDAWSEFAQTVEDACIGATDGILTEASAVVDPFGSASYGLAVVSGNTVEGRASIVCVFDKQTEAVEIGGELDLDATRSEDDDMFGPAPVSGTLEPLSETDLSEAALEGELACSFSQGDEPPLLFAMGIVGSEQPAEAIAKMSGATLRLAAPGGFNAIVDGTEFSGEAGSIDIVVTGQTDEGGESPARMATLSADLGEDSVSIDGLWHCGP